MLCGLVVAVSVLINQWQLGEYQSAMTTIAGILAILGIGADVRKTNDHLIDIRNNPVMPGTPIAPESTPEDKQTFYDSRG